MYSRNMTIHQTVGKSHNSNFKVNAKQYGHLLLVSLSYLSRGNSFLDGMFHQKFIRHLHFITEQAEDMAQYFQQHSYY